LTDGLALKADVGGTSAETFKLNQDYTGVPGADITLEVERGAEVNVAIRWNETSNLWEYTNDGAVWHYFTSNDGTDDVMIKTYTQAAEPTLDTNNKAAFWIDSDDANKVYLVFRRGVGDQVKVELT